jgi:hypothetical protein
LRERTAKENGVGASDRRVLVIAFIANSKLGYLTKEKRGTTPLSYGQPHCIVWGMLLLTFPLYWWHIAWKSHHGSVLLLTGSWLCNRLFQQIFN